MLALLLSAMSAQSAQIAQFRITDTGEDETRIVTLGLPLSEGQVDPQAQLVVLRDGVPLPSQWNPLSRWRSDGSQLHGALSFAVPGDGSGTYTVATGQSADGTKITKADLLEAGFDAAIEVKIGSRVFALSAADLLSGKVTPRQVYDHFTGPLAAEFVLGGSLRDIANNSTHRTLQGYFHIRAFARPVKRVYVTMVLENTGVFNLLKDVTGDVTLRVGDETRYFNPDFPIHADKRYPKRFWWNGDPRIFVTHDVEAVQDTRLVPEYRDVRMDRKVLAQYPRQLDWHEVGQLNPAMDSGGSHRHIAPLDTWSAAYLVSGDRRAYLAMRAHDDAYDWVTTKHRYAMNPRSEKTGFPLDLREHPQIIGSAWGGAGDAEPMAARRQTNKPLKTDLAHEPANGYLTYLLTAEFEALESAQLWAVSAYTRERPGSYPGWPRSFYTGQVRAVAWGLRNIVNAAVITPDAHPLKKTLVEGVLGALNSLNDVARPLDPQDKLGLLLTGPGVSTGIHRPDRDGNRNGTSPWMQDYLTWAIGSAYERGFAQELDANGLWTWRSQSIVGRLGDGQGYCWAYAAQYNLRMMDTETTAIYPDWTAVMNKNFGRVTCPAIGEDDLGSDRSATDYGAQMAAALAIAADTDQPGAAAAWARYEGRKFRWSVGFDKRPEFAIERRH